MVWETSWLTTQIHALPHMDSNLRITNNYFDMTSPSYRTSLLILGLGPTIIFLIPLIGFLIWRLAFERYEKNEIVCPCKLQNWLRVFVTILTVLVILCILLEFLLHGRGMDDRTGRYTINPNILKTKEVVFAASKFDENQQINFKQPYTEMNFFVYLLTNTLSYEPAPNYHLDKVVEPYKLLYGKYQTEFQRGIANIQSPTVEPKEFETNRLAFLKNYELKRFVLFLVLWCIGLLLTLAGPHRNWIVAALLLLWCSIVSIMLIVLLVALSDFCQDPLTLSAEMTDEEEMRNIVSENLEIVCEDWNYKLMINKNAFRKLIASWDRTFVRYRLEVEREYSTYWFSAMGNFWLVRDYRYQYLKKVCYYFTQMKEQNSINNHLRKVKELECSQIDVNDDDLPTEDFSSACQGDYQVWLLLLQLILVLIIALITFLLFLVHCTRIHSYRYYEYIVKNMKMLKSATPPQSYKDRIARLKNCRADICQEAKICKCKKKYTPKPPKMTKEEKALKKVSMEDEDYAIGRSCYSKDYSLHKFRQSN